MDKQQLSKADIKRACDILRMDDGVGAGNYIEQLSWLLFLKVFENIEYELHELAKTEGKEYKEIIDTDYKWSTWAKKDWKDKDELVYFVNQKLFPYLRTLNGTPEKEKVAEIFREITNRIHSPHTLLDTVDILDSIKMEHFQDTHLLSQTYEEILQALGSEGGWSGEFYTPRPIIRLVIKVVNPKLGEKVLDPFVGSAGFLVESFDYIQSQNPKMGVKEWERLQHGTFYGQEKKPIPFLIGMMNMILHRILVPNLIRTNTLMEDVHSMPESQKVEVVLTNPPFGGKENKSVQNNYPVPSEATEALALQYVMRRLKTGGRAGIVLPEGEILFGGGAMQQVREELFTKFNVTAIISLPKGVFSQMGADTVKTDLIFFEKTGPTKEIWFGEVGGKFTKSKTIRDDHLVDVYKKYLSREISELSWIETIDELKAKNYDLRVKNPNKQVAMINDLSSNITVELTSSGKVLDGSLSNLVNSLKDIDNSVSNFNFEEIDIGEEKFFEIIQGKTPKKTDYTSENTGLKIVKFRDLIVGGTLNFEAAEGGFVKSGQDRGLKDLHQNYILITNSAHSPEHIGKKISFVEKLPDYKKIYFVGELTAIKCDEEFINPKYIYYILSSPLGYELIQNRVREKHLIKSEVAKIKIKIPYENGVPSREKQDLIVDELDNFYGLARDYEKLLDDQEMKVNNLKRAILSETLKY